jgi:hypothetical protein
MRGNRFSTDLIPEVIRWRYWLLPSDEIRLSPISPKKDTTTWLRGVTRAACRHDRSHVPPEPGCTCGLYAVGPVDIRYMVALRQWAHKQRIRVKYGMLAAVLPATKVPPLASAVIGEVTMFDARPFSYPVTTMSHPDGGRWPEVPAVRAGSARISRLWVPEDRAEVADPLGDIYGVTCDVGDPTYTQADWDARTQWDSDPHLLFPSHEDFGLNPPRATFGGIPR